MAVLSKSETQRIEQLVQNLFAFKQRTDEKMYGGPADFEMRKIEAPSTELLTEAKNVVKLLSSRKIDAPLLKDLVIDQSPFQIKKVIHELRAIEEEFGEE